MSAGDQFPSGCLNLEFSFPSNLSDDFNLLMKSAKTIIHTINLTENDSYSGPVLLLSQEIQTKTRQQSLSLLTKPERNFHVDSVTSFQSLILLCQWSPHIINIQLHVLNRSSQHCYMGYFFGLLEVSMVRFACGQLYSILLAVSLTSFCLQLASFACWGNSVLSP